VYLIFIGENQYLTHVSSWTQQSSILDINTTEVKQVWYRKGREGTEGRTRFSCTGLMNASSSLQINFFFARGCLKNLWGLGQIKNVEGLIFITDTARQSYSVGFSMLNKGVWGLASRKILRIRPSEIEYNSDFSSLKTSLIDVLG